jgi:signal transduction histidine kinase
LQEAAIAQERVRLAADLHDSAMQVMTAAALQLKHIAETEHEPAVRDGIEEVRMQLLGQQREIRSFIDTLQTTPTNKPVRLDPAIRRTLSKVEEIWRCATSAEVVPPSTTVPECIQRQIDFILLEAAANACRHGHAKTISVTARAERNSLKLCIVNDGSVPEFADTGAEADGTAEDFGGPHSIRKRVAALGGAMTIMTSRKGFELDMTLPVTHDQFSYSSGAGR